MRKLVGTMKRNGKEIKSVTNNRINGNVSAYYTIASEIQLSIRQNMTREENEPGILSQLKHSISVSFLRKNFEKMTGFSKIVLE